MIEGWISLHRKFLSWEWFSDTNMVKLFIYLLLKANHSKNSWRGVDINRGQLLTGLDSLSKETNISKQTLRTCLKRLENTGEINTQITNKYRIITLCNYDSYQDNKQVTNKQSNKQLTSNQQAINKQLTANNNVNKENKEINNIISFLNEKTGKDFKSSSKATQTKINARLKEGFTEIDFRKVIELKTKEWLNKPDMIQYLRPETLFGTKFESYLNSDNSHSSKQNNGLTSFNVKSRFGYSKIFEAKTEDEAKQMYINHYGCLLEDITECKK